MQYFELKSTARLKNGFVLSSSNRTKLKAQRIRDFSAIVAVCSRKSGSITCIRDKLATWLQLLYIHEVGRQMDPMQKFSGGSYHELGFDGDFTIIEVEMIFTRIHNLDGG